VKIEVFDKPIEPALKSLRREMLKGGVFKDMEAVSLLRKSLP
jgi:ribosomal protein S21